MTKVQIPIYKEVLDKYSTLTESDIRKHFFISYLMETQSIKQASLHENYEGNYITALEARDILGHRTYLEAISQMIEDRLLTPLGKTSTYKHQLHFFESMDLAPYSQFTIPPEMKRVNNSINRLMSKKLNMFSPGGNLALKNISDQDFGVNCNKEEFKKYYMSCYPEYVAKKKKARTRLKDGTLSQPLDLDSYRKVHSMTWDTLEWFMNSDRGMAWRYVSDDDKFCNRVYTIATSWPKYLRECISYNNERTVILDLKQSGPTFLAKILNSINPDNDYSKFMMNGGDLYELLGRKFGKSDRNTAKRIYNIWAYGDTGTFYFKKLAPIFPKASETMAGIKPIDYKIFARMVYQEESRVFRLVWDELDSKIGWFLTCHDEVIVPRGIQSEAFSIMNGILSTELGEIPFNIREE